MKFLTIAPRRKKNGFSLILSLVVMAMLLLLCVGATALLSIQLRVAQASVGVAKARMNAIVGARIALGEIQRTLGPDQRVSATAEILCDPTQTDPTKPGYYNNALNGMVVHPRWLGVWNSGKVDDASVPKAATGEETKVIQRTTDGVLMDSRFIGTNDWGKSRAGKTPSGVTKRFVGWLVSGNEALQGSNANALTPFTAVAGGSSRQNDPMGRAEDVALVEAGTLGRTLPGPGNRSDGDYLGVRAARVVIPGQTSSGNYAYWVSDEGVKARINLSDKFEAITPNHRSMTDGGMCRLQIPQRNDFTLVRNPADTGNAVAWTNYASIAKNAPGGWGPVQDFTDLAMIDTSLDAAKVKNFYFNDITFDSAGVACDVVNGGLKKDLTAYFNNDGGNIPDYQSVAGSGIQETTKILNDPTLDKISPQIGLLYDWYSKSSLASSDDSGAVSTRAPDSVSRNYNISYYCSSVQVASTYTLSTPVYANTKHVAPLSPVLSRFDVYYVPSFSLPRTASNVRVLVYPRIDLWNPYAVPITIPAARVAWVSNINMLTNVYSQYESGRAIRWFNFNDVTLEPGQAVTFVPRSGQDISGVSPTNSIPPDIQMERRTTPGYYLDRAWNTSGNFNAVNTSGGGNTVNYYWPFGAETQTPTSAKAPIPDYFTKPPLNIETTGSGPVSQLFLTTGGSNTVVQQANMDPWCTLINVPGSPYKRINLIATGFSSPVYDVAGAAAAGPVAECHYGYRFMFLDDNTNTGTQPVRNANYNPFVNGNFRATRYTRHPLDDARVTRVNNTMGSNLFATDGAVAYNSPAIIPASAGEASPYVSYSQVLNGSAKRFILLDVPRRSTGLLSLGQLQGVPFVQLPWAPGIPFGNALTPVQTGLVSESMSSRTGYTLTEETTVWNKVNNTSEFNRNIRQQDSGSTVWGAANLSGQRTLIDWSYELNHALWDSWMTSGIGPKNDGWSDPLGWDFKKLNLAEGAIPNSRLVSAGVSVPSGSAYFSNDRASNYAAYRAAYTLLQKGQFNVNSTSVVAWEALLGAFRGISNPTRDGSTNGAEQTPYSRLTVPATGPVTPASAYNTAALVDQKTWGGFRALDDAEVRKLAQKIVEQVKIRGPFLSLSDFVNRRLIPETVQSYGTLTNKEANFLGTLQAAINEAELNAGLSPASGDPVYLNRTTANTPPLAAAIKPETKAKDKLAGAPGYLLQSDVLQKLAPVLSARSDTFKIRARGESEEGAVVYVELTVQRSTAPLASVNTGASQNLPVNPKSAAPGTNFEGNQFFGRRMNIVRTRWLNSDEI